jgi:hypothetical protein
MSALEWAISLTMSGKRCSQPRTFSACSSPLFSTYAEYIHAKRGAPKFTARTAPFTLTNSPP